MELRDYLKLIGKHLTLVIVIAFLTGITTLAYSKFQPKTYTAATTIIVNKESALKQSNANYYLFDNYYNVQSSGLFAKMLATWFSSPALVQEIYQKANVPVPDISQKALGKIFKSIYDEPASITISIVGKNPEELNRLINAAGEVIQDKTNEMGKSDTAFYDIVKFATINTENKANLPLNTIIGLIGGLMLGIVVALSTEYFKGGNKA